MSACIVPGCRGGDRGQPADAGYGRHACEPCVRDAQRRLREIEIYASVLPLLITSTSAVGERRASGFGSRSPVREDILVALDYRSYTGGDGPDDEEHPVRSILGTLHGLARFVREQQELPEPRQEPTIPSAGGFLRASMEWCARADWVGDHIADIRELHLQCRWLAGYNLESFSNCPTEMSDGAPCGKPLYMPIVGDTIECHGCSSEWPRPLWEHLARVLNTTAGRRPG